MVVVFGYPPILFGQTKEAVLVAAGDIAGCYRGQRNATAKLLDRIAGMVFTVGDNVYSHGTALECIECYSMS